MGDCGYFNRPPSLALYVTKLSFGFVFRRFSDRIYLFMSYIRGSDLRNIGERMSNKTVFLATLTRYIIVTKYAPDVSTLSLWFAELVLALE